MAENVSHIGSRMCGVGAALLCAATALVWLIVAPSPLAHLLGGILGALGLGRLWYLCLFIPAELRRGEGGADVQAANDPMADVFAHAGHDLRQPVQAIVLFAASLSAQSLPEPQRKVVQGIESAVEQLSGMVTSISGLAKIRASRLSVKPKGVTAGDVLLRAVQANFDIADERGILLRSVRSSARLNVDPDVLDIALKTCLDQVLIAAGEGGGVVAGVRRRGAKLWFELRTSYAADLAQRGTWHDLQPNHGVCALMPDKGYGFAYAEQLTRLAGGEFTLCVYEGKGSVVRLVFPAALA